MKKLLILVIIGAAIAGAGYLYVDRYGMPSSDGIKQAEAFKQLSIDEKRKKLPAYALNYISGADVDKNFAEAVKQAQAQKKNIFLIAGGNWCKWCGNLDAFFDNNPDAFNALYDNYVVVKAFYRFDKNKVDVDFFDKLPSVKATPHFYVFNKDGKLVTNIGSAKFEQGYGYNKRKMIQLLNKYNIKGL
ncbi:MAG: DUF255 domain-containing protein [uncultured Campylobacterales bacterium]|uniref:DUF255 domain-containing protein n=1 Tax=uncultured Campylobacterales bacterium TaxID=352960 RepID=A0A6S6S3B7_9BACT|nr:MAG: DUF255 domain-containing protein [uncultured Campylobacterales bacterium]